MKKSIFDLFILLFFLCGCSDSSSMNQPEITDESSDSHPELNQPVTKLIWGIGDNFAGARNSALLHDTNLKLISHWYNGPQDMSWICGYKEQTTVSDFYSEGYGIQLIIWLAQNRETADYAIGEQFQNDIRELIEIFKGNGPCYGPLYVVLFTELETYPPAGGGQAAEEYKQCLSQAYIQAAKIIHDTYDKALVGLGLGGYHWPEQVPGTRDITRWEAAIEVSDFTCVQQMQSYKNWSQIPGKTRNAVHQLGSYGLPVMVSHFKIWSGGPDDNPDPIEKKISDAQNAFNLFMDNMFTDESLKTLYADGLRAWVFMNDEYIRKHGDGDEVYGRAMNFIASHNEENPLMQREAMPPTPSPENYSTILVYDFDDGTLEPVVEKNIDITAGTFQNYNLSFTVFSSSSDPHAINDGKWIQDHGQGPTHINALTENEAINVNSGNQKNNYLSFTITPSNDKKLNLYWVTWDMQARTGDPSTPPELVYYAALYSCKDGILTPIGKPCSVASNVENSVSGWSTAQFDISKQTFSIGESVEFRIYVWRDGKTDQRAERWLEFDNIKVYGCLE